MKTLQKITHCYEGIVVFRDGEARYMNWSGLKAKYPPPVKIWLAKPVSKHLAEIGIKSVALCPYSLHNRSGAVYEFDDGNILEVITL